jgi:hypothetical protein
MNHTPSQIEELALEIIETRKELAALPMIDEGIGPVTNEHRVALQHARAIRSDLRQAIETFNKADPAQAILTLTARCREVEEALKRELKLKNSLVLMAYPMMDAIKRLNRHLETFKYANDLMTIAQIRDVISAPSADNSSFVAVTDVANERERQKTVEGCTLEGDDRYKNGEMAYAAAWYAINAQSHDYDDMRGIGNGTSLDHAFEDEFSWCKWPWSRGWWKPTNRRRDLVKAAALIVAEIERLDRALAETPQDGIRSEKEL